MKPHRLITLVFFCFNVAFVFGSNAGPFFDEGIYITAGIRTLQGYGYSDGYMSWFAGSLIWPALAGLTYTVGGLLLTRIAAVFFVSLGILGSIEATNNLFGEKVARWTALMFIVCAPVVALSHLGAYDVPAFAGIGIALWSITMLTKTDHRVWVVVASISFIFAMLSKYAVGGLSLIPLIGVLVYLRREKARIDVPMFGFLSGIIFLAVFLPLREQIGAMLYWVTSYRPTFGSTRTMIWFAVLFFSIPTSIALFALFRKEKRLLIFMLVVAGFMWPLYHGIRGDPVGDWKHIGNGFLFVFPAIGVVFTRLWDTHRKFISVVLYCLLALVGLNQLGGIDNVHPDVRTGAQYLVQEVQPGDKLLINDSWPYNLYLYSTGKIENPWDIYDTYRIAQKENPIPLCQYDWFVDEKGSYEWPAEVIQEIQSCGFKPVLSFTTRQRGLASDLQYHTAPVITTIWKKSPEVEVAAK